MKLREVLETAGVNENTYHAIQRRTSLSFMRLMLLSETKQDRYRPGHALALAAFQELVAKGLTATEADDLVTKVFAFIEVFAREPEKVPAEQAWLSFLFPAWNGDYSLDHIPAVEVDRGPFCNGRMMSGEPAATVIALNLAMLWAPLAQQLNATE